MKHIYTKSEILNQTKLEKEQRGTIFYANCKSHNRLLKYYKFADMISTGKYAPYLIRIFAHGNLYLCKQLNITQTKNKIPNHADNFYR